MQSVETWGLFFRAIESVEEEEKAGAQGRAKIDIE
jgi:hypothetical protein